MECGARVPPVNIFHTRYQLVLLSFQNTFIIANLGSAPTISELIEEGIFKNEKEKGRPKNYRERCVESLT